MICLTLHYHLWTHWTWPQEVPIEWAEYFSSRHSSPRVEILQSCANGVTFELICMPLPNVCRTWFRSADSRCRKRTLLLLLGKRRLGQPALASDNTFGHVRVREFVGSQQFSARLFRARTRPTFSCSDVFGWLKWLFQSAYICLQEEESAALRQPLGFSLYL